MNGYFQGNSGNNYFQQQNYGNSGFNNNFGSMGSNNLTNWFLTVLNNQLMELVNMGRLDGQMLNVMMRKAQANAGNYINWLNQRCNGNIEQAPQQVLAEAFGSIAQNITEILQQEYNHNLNNNTNQILGAMAGNNRFGNTNMGNSGMMPMYNNQPQMAPLTCIPTNNPQQYDRYGHQQPTGCTVTTVPQSDIPARYRPENNPQLAGYATPSPQPAPVQVQTTDDMNALFNTPKTTNHHTTTTMSEGDVKPTIRQVNAGANIVLESVDVSTSWGGCVSIEGINVIDDIVREKAVTKPRAAKMLKKSSFMLKKGVNMPIVDEQTIEVVEAVGQVRNNIPKEKNYSYHESSITDAHIVDDAGDNYLGLTTTSVDRMAITGPNNKKSEVICVSLESDDIVVDEEQLTKDLRSGSIISTHIKQGDRVCKVAENDENRQLAFSVKFDTMEVLDIPVEEFAPVHESISKLCTIHSVDTFDKFFDDLIEILYKLPRGMSEIIDEKITDHLNNVFMSNMYIFKRGISKPITISKVINIYDILTNPKITELTSDQTATIRKLVFATISNVFGGMVVDPDDERLFEVILDNPISSTELAKHHKLPISSDEYHSWDKESDRDLITKLTNNVKKFTAMTVNNNMVVTTLVPTIHASLTNWLFSRGDLSVDPFTMLVIRSLEEAPTTTKMWVNNPVTGSTMGEPDGLVRIGTTLDRYYGYMLVA